MKQWRRFVGWGLEVLLGFSALLGAVWLAALVLQAFIPAMRCGQ